VAALALAAAPARADDAPLTLERAMRLAVERDERAAIADQEVVVADARVDRARAFFFPSITASGDYRYRGEPGNFQEHNVVTAGLAGRITLFDGRGFPLYQATTLERDAARLDRREARRQIAFEAGRAFLATLGAQAVHEAAEHRIDFARLSLADARGRARAQLASTNDVTRAELELATAGLEQRRAEGDWVEARLQLGWLLGHRVDGRLAAPDALLGARSATSATSAVRGEAAAGRLDLAALAARAAAAAQLTKETAWRWAPSIAAVAEATTTSVGGVSGKTTDWFVGLSAVWQLWDGGGRTADRHARQAESRIARLRVEQDTRRAALETASATAAVDTARRTTSEAETAVVAARRNVEETRTLYKQGLARALEVADASARLFEVEVALARERVGLGVAVLALDAARGGDPLSEERKP
jgi:outer membrane protein TolC